MRRSCCAPIRSSAGLPDGLKDRDESGIGFNMRFFAGQQLHRITIRIKFNRQEFSRTCSIRNQLRAERIQEFRRIQFHRPAFPRSVGMNPALQQPREVAESKG